MATEPKVTRLRLSGMKVRPIVVTLVLALTAACSGNVGRAASATGPVPDVTVRSPTRVLRLSPYTYCWNRGCADGFLRRPRLIGRSGRLGVQTLPNATIHVALQAPAWSRRDLPLMTERCGRRFSATVRADARGRAAVTPMGPAGSYGIELFVNPASGGDLIVGFNWTTTRAGPTNAPRSEVSILADHDGSVDSYGVEFGVSDLATTPTTATASVRVTAADGTATTIELVRRPEVCTEGTVAFAAPDEAGLRAARSGPKPFTYDVALVLDGVRHTAHAMWPRDEDDKCSPCVPLRYSPPLPRLRL